MKELIPYIPIISTVVSFTFTFILFQHWNRKKNFYILWWMLGVLTYGLGTLTESINTLYGWNEVNFKAWYILGALLGGAPLAQGTVYLLMGNKVGHVLTTILVITVVVASIFVIGSPIKYELVAPRLSGDVLEWEWVRIFSRFINPYAAIVFVGGAFYSAYKYSQEKQGASRMYGNIWIAIGGILPGFGGYYTRLGFVEVLYVTELLGLICIITGYYIIKNDKTGSVHKTQAQVKA